VVMLRVAVELEAAARVQVATIQTVTDVAGLTDAAAIATNPQGTLMASIEKRGPRCYVVRWRTPDGKSRTKTLKREVDAKRFRTSIEHSKDVGTYLDPGRSKITVKPWAAQCMAAWAHLKPSVPIPRSVADLLLDVMWEACR
jgi:hypothetical protein